MDRYTKVILTIIAILLTLHLIKPLLIPKEVGAQMGVLDVNIAEVGGKTVHVSVFDMGVMDSGIPVFVTEIKSR